MSIANLYAGLPAMIAGEQASDDRYRGKRLENMKLMEEFQKLYPDAGVDVLVKKAEELSGGSNWLKGQMPTREMFQAFAKEQETRRSDEATKRKAMEVQAQAQLDDFLDRQATRAAETATTPEEFEQKFLAFAGPASDQARTRLASGSGAQGEFGIRQEAILNKFSTDFIQWGVRDRGKIAAHLGPQRAHLVDRVFAVVDGHFKEKDRERSAANALREQEMRMRLFDMFDPNKNLAVRQTLVAGGDVSQIIGPAIQAMGLPPAIASEVSKWAEGQSEAVNRIDATINMGRAEATIVKTGLEQAKDSQTLAKGWFGTDDLWKEKGVKDSGKIAAAKAIGMTLAEQGYVFDNPDAAMAAIATQVQKGVTNPEQVAQSIGAKKVTPDSLASTARTAVTERYAPRPWEQYSERFHQNFNVTATALSNVTTALEKAQGVPDATVYNQHMAAAVQGLNYLGQEIAMLQAHPEIAYGEKATQVRELREKYEGLRQKVEGARNDYFRRKQIGLSTTAQPAAAPRQQVSPEALRGANKAAMEYAEELRSKPWYEKTAMRDPLYLQSIAQKHGATVDQVMGYKTLWQGLGGIE